MINKIIIILLIVCVVMLIASVVSIVKQSCRTKQLKKQNDLLFKKIMDVEDRQSEYFTYVVRELRGENKK